MSNMQKAFKTKAKCGLRMMYGGIVPGAQLQGLDNQIAMNKGLSGLSMADNLALRGPNGNVSHTPRGMRANGMTFLSPGSAAESSMLDHQTSAMQSLRDNIAKQPGQQGLPTTQTLPQMPYAGGGVSSSLPLGTAMPQASTPTPTPTPTPTSSGGDVDIVRKGNSFSGLGMADGGVVKETPEQMMARIAAKYGTGSSSPAPAPAPAPAPTPQPAPQPQPSQQAGLRQVLSDRNEQLRKVANYRRGGIVHGRGTPTSDSVPVHLSPGEAVLPHKVVTHLGGPESVENLITSITGHPTATQGLRAGGHYEGGLSGLWDSVYGTARNVAQNSLDGIKSLGQARGAAPQPAPVTPTVAAAPQPGVSVNPPAPPPQSAAPRPTLTPSVAPEVSVKEVPMEEFNKAANSAENMRARINQAATGEAAAPNAALEAERAALAAKDAEYARQTAQVGKAAETAKAAEVAKAAKAVEVAKPGLIRRGVNLAGKGLGLAGQAAGTADIGLNAYESGRDGGAIQYEPSDEEYAKYGAEDNTQRTTRMAKHALRAGALNIGDAAAGVANDMVVDPVNWAARKLGLGNKQLPNVQDAWRNAAADYFAPGGAGSAEGRVTLRGAEPKAAPAVVQQATAPQATPEQLAMQAAVAQQEAANTPDPRFTPDAKQPGLRAGTIIADPKVPSVYGRSSVDATKLKAPEGGGYITNAAGKAVFLPPPNAEEAASIAQRNAQPGPRDAYGNNMSRTLDYKRQLANIQGQGFLDDLTSANPGYQARGLRGLTALAGQHAQENDLAKTAMTTDANLRARLAQIQYDNKWKNIEQGNTDNDRNDRQQIAGRKALEEMAKAEAGTFEHTGDKDKDAANLEQTFNSRMRFINANGIKLPDTPASLKGPGKRGLSYDELYRQDPQSALLLAKQAFLHHDVNDILDKYQKGGSAFGRGESAGIAPQITGIGDRKFSDYVGGITATDIATGKWLPFMSGTTIHFSDGMGGTRDLPASELKNNPSLQKFVLQTIQKTKADMEAPSTRYVKNLIAN